MAITKDPQNKQKETTETKRSEFLRKTYEDVWQDNSASHRERIASAQAYPVWQWPRSRPLDKNSDRSKKRSTKRQTVSITAWIKKPIKATLDDIARREGLTRSKVAARFLEWAVTESLHRQTAELIPAVIEQSFNKVVGKRLARTDSLLVRAAIDISQTRTLSTNVLGRQAGVNADTLNMILDNSLEKAKEDLTKRSPEMEEFIASAVLQRQQEQTQTRRKEDRAV